VVAGLPLAFAVTALAAALVLAVAAAALAAALASTYELRRRRELVARACHELRGPLTAVRLSIATMERHSEAPPERLAILDLELRRAGLALDDFAAARSGRRVLDRTEPVEIAELLEEQYESWYAVAGAFDSQVALGALAPGAVVDGDRLRLAQAVSNLVANALEHGPGRVELTARLIGQRHVRIEVIDEGPGLPAPVAELTRRARAGRGRRGRGLAIAAEIAERHGGRLVAAPTSRGARIGLELPFLRRAS
jgi:signal transduction histidine kinase